MVKNPKPEPDNAEQSARFVETAKQLQADESGKAFENALDIINEKKPNKANLQQKNGQ